MTEGEWDTEICSLSSVKRSVNGDGYEHEHEYGDMMAEHGWTQPIFVTHVAISTNERTKTIMHRKRLDKIYHDQHGTSVSIFPSIQLQPEKLIDSKLNIYIFSKYPSSHGRWCISTTSLIPLRLMPLANKTRRLPRIQKSELLVIEQKHMKIIEKMCSKYNNSYRFSKWHKWVVFL